jgi:hypothetical protein
MGTSTRGGRPAVQAWTGGGPRAPGCLWSAQHERAGIIGIGLRTPWWVRSDSAGRRLAGLGNGGRRQDRERDRDGCADENRQSHEYAAEKLHVDHLRSPVVIVLAPFFKTIL